MSRTNHKGKSFHEGVSFLVAAVHAETSTQHREELRRTRKCRPKNLEKVRSSNVYGAQREAE
jgi:hypothetical protein